MKRKPVIGITMGDFNGIGPEITLKAIASSKVRKLCTPVLVGSIEVFERTAKALGYTITLREVMSPSDSPMNLIQIINSHPFMIPKVTVGTVSGIAGIFAGRAIETAVDFWSVGDLDGIVTAPVSKEAMRLAGYRFPGQTEMVASLSKGKRFMMMLLAGKFRVGLATIHVPLQQVPGLISKKNLLNKLSILHESLKNDFAIYSPRIAVLGLNPHAGENGQIGTEEKRIIIPALMSARNQGLKVDGPFPADGFFGKQGHESYDAVLAMYHDQGLIPLKMQGFELGVNVTLGLPIVRTSPDHGTAFDIAGKGIANSSSMIEAIKLAVQIVQNRKR